MSTTTEMAIVTALRTGNPRRAVELMLDVYQEEVLVYCLRLAGSEAASAYQRVLASAAEKILSVDGQSSVRAWLFRIARGAILELRRRDYLRYPGVLEAGYAPVVGPDDAPGVRLRDEVLEDSLAQLDPAALEVLELSLWHGLLLSEVAYVVGRSEAEVRRLASHGLATVDLEVTRRSQGPS